MESLSPKNEEDAPQIASNPEATQKPQYPTEEELLGSSSDPEVEMVSDTERSTAPLSEAVKKLQLNEGAKRQRVKLSGAARRRLKWLMKKGLAFEEAREKCQEPVPEKGRSKRPRSEDTTPESAKAEKRVRKSVGERSEATLEPKPSTSTAPTLNFKEALTKLKVGIFHSNYPEEYLNKDQMMTIQEEILVRVNDGPVSPKFSGLSLRPGWLCITCDNKDTAEWLIGVTGSIKPWEGASLKAVEEKDLPRSKILSGYFPNSSETTSEKIVDLLKGQNRELNVAEWRVVHRSNEGTAAHLLLSVDIASVELLRKADFKVSFRFGKVALHSKSEGTKPKPKPKARKAPPAASGPSTSQRDKPEPTASTSGTQASGKVPSTSKGAKSKEGHFPPLDPPQRGFRPGKGKEHKPRKPKK